MTQSVLADLAGLSQGYLSQIEQGRVEVNKISVLQAIAQALQISVADLAAHAAPSQSLYESMSAPMEKLRSALLSLSWVPDGEEAVRPDSGFLDRVAQLYTTCRFDVVVPAIAEGIVELHRSMHLHPKDSVRALRSLVFATQYATWACKSLGHADLAIIAAECCWAAAQRLGEPEYLGVGNYALLKAVASTDGHLAARLMARGADLLTQQAGQSRRSAEILGLHHLEMSLVAARENDTDLVAVHLHEARELADRVVEGSFGRYYFGQTNFAIWRMAIMIDLGRPGQATLENPEVRILPSPERRATFFLHRAQALIGTRGHDTEAIAALRRAEAEAPQLIRIDDRARRAAEVLAHRARTRNGDLLEIAQRLGVYK